MSSTLKRNLEWSIQAYVGIEKNLGEVKQKEYCVPFPYSLHQIN